jgi:prolyl-tRNA synthetase
MRLSELYAPTLRESPAEADIESARLLLRAAMIRKVAAGVYTFLPLGFRVLRKVEEIVRQEMERVGAQEILMPALQPAELWERSGRWDEYGPELMRLEDRAGRGFALGPTHEELVTSTVQGELRSYRQLPLTLFQIQVKFRDEVRPRFGLLRAREFIMKDAYSYHATQESLEETYDAMAGAYARICERTGLQYREVEAHGGLIGGKVTREFMALADNGEAEIAYCDACDYAADVEAAESIPERAPIAKERPLEKVHTPSHASIAEVSEFLEVAEREITKTMAADSPSGLVFFLVPGDRDLNEFKAEAVVAGAELLADEDFAKHGLVKGFVGPAGAPKGVKIVADRSLKQDKAWVVGANELDFHFLGAQAGRDFEVDLWTDLVVAREGDACARCDSGTLAVARGIEVSQVFQLGTKYSEAMGATFTDEEGREQPFLMGCYGVGITRTMAAVVEQYADERGVAWPATVAPFEIEIIPVGKGEEAVALAEELYSDAEERGLEAAIDDRDESAGVKFSDADLIGSPVQLVVGRRAAEGVVELKLRSTGEREELPATEAVGRAATLIREMKAGLDL